MTTMIEAGVPGFVSVAWFAVAAPPGTPDPIIQKVNADINKLLATEDVERRYRGLGAEVLGGSVQRMASHVEQQRKLWGGVIRDAKIPQVE
jgi:tripartite-type tricarboxylate transporter receptor subunit TctC